MNPTATASSFRDRLSQDILLGDGANGTLIRDMGFASFPYDLANIEAPELVLQAHRAYVDAGADIIETNTFCSSRIRLAGTNWDVAELNRAGARLARQAAGAKAFVLGAIGPAGRHLEPIGPITEAQVYESVREQAAALAEGGVDGIILETYLDMREIEVAVRAVRDACDLPLLVSKVFSEDGDALADGLPTRVARELEAMGVDAIGANCGVGPQRMVDIVRMVAEGTNLPVFAFPTPGLPQMVKQRVVYDVAPEYFAKASARLVEEGARLVGGCCGTTPDHIRELRKLIDAGIKKSQAKAKTTTNGVEKRPLPVAEPTELARKLGKKFIITVEMDLPRGLNVKKVLDGARSLKIKGADIIDISDGARARLRMNPLSVSKLIQDEVGIEVMMHFACRDRNLLAVQADLLGAHALGVRNILAITGDPANIGDYPSATSVYDVDSIGLVRILNRFNEGIDMAGNTVGMKCAFTTAVAYNPLASDLAEELDRLRRKASAGAQIVYTQPIFEERYIDEALEICRELTLPLFIGVLPLRSSRHAEFMHNEVPGITVPDWLRKRIGDAPDDDSALSIGIEEAQKLSSRLKSSAQGLYLMPPFGNHQIAERVMDAVL